MCMVSFNFRIINTLKRDYYFVLKILKNLNVLREVIPKLLQGRKGKRNQSRNKVNKERLNSIEFNRVRNPITA